MNQVVRMPVVVTLRFCTPKFREVFFPDSDFLFDQLGFGVCVRKTHLCARTDLLKIISFISCEQITQLEVENANSAKQTRSFVRRSGTKLVRAAIAHTTQKHSLSEWCSA
jgi:hypothetical protein